VHTALRKLVEEAQASYPDLPISMSQPFGVHPALVEIVIKRIHETTVVTKDTAIVLMAHGTPTPEANKPIYEIAKRVEAALDTVVRVAFMECNEPTISQAIDTFVGQGFETIINLPYFLHMGSHVKEDLPAIINQARAHYSARQIILSEHLGFDERLVSVIEDRVKNKGGEGKV
jgi:sirohydrochlorin cobaltochelatase